MHQDILPRVIFSPGQLGLELASGLKRLGVDVTLYSAGPVRTDVRNVHADLTGFEAELEARGDSYLELLKKHPLVFISLARQAQSEIIARAYDAANRDELDVVHIYTNEEDIALPFAKLCQKPVVFTHHDPFNFLVKYRHVFPKYAACNWISLSMAQRTGMPPDTHWVGDIPHGIDETAFTFNGAPQGDYVAYLGRIVEPKGLHLAVAAVKHYNETAKRPLSLRIAGKHYSGSFDGYYAKKIAPLVDGATIRYDQHIGDRAELGRWLGNARALLVPSVFDEPFGMVMIEALACGTPVIGLDSGAIPEVVEEGVTGFVVSKHMKESIDPRAGHMKMLVDEAPTVAAMAAALGRVGEIDRSVCRRQFERRFTSARMCRDHVEVYQKLVRG